MDKILYTSNALIWWFMFAIWSRDNPANVIVKMVFLALALMNSLAALLSFGFLIGV